MRPLLLLLAAVLPLLYVRSAAPSPILQEIAEKLTAQNTLQRRPFPPTLESLQGRVILIWDITQDFVKFYEAVNAKEKNEDTIERLALTYETADQALRRNKEIKKALATGQLLILYSLNVSQAELKTYRSGRRLNLRGHTYALHLPSQVIGADGKQLFTVNNIEDLAKGDRLTNVLADAPDYYPGGIVHIKTEHHRKIVASLIKGKNIEKVLPNLRRMATGRDEKAEEAKRILAEVEAYLKETCASIEADLKGAPSRAIRQIDLLQKTAPSRARRYLGAANAMRRNQEVKQLSNARDFLEAATQGAIGANETARSADAHLETLKEMSKHRNPAIAAEAELLKTAIAPFSGSEQARLRKEARDQARAKRQTKDDKDDDKAPKTKRLTAGDWLAKSAGAATIAPLLEELNRLEHETCNYESLRNAYAPLAQKKGERATAAQAVLQAIDDSQKEQQSELARIQKEGKPLDLYAQEDWEHLMTVTFPSLQSTPPGRVALKMLRDSELRTLYNTYIDAKSGAPEKEEDQSHEEHLIKTTQYRQAKLRALLKYRNTKTPFGRLAVAQLDSLGYSEKDIQQHLDNLENKLKEQKTAQKAAEKRREEREKANKKKKKD